MALGPLVGGAVVDGISWHWIFWINVPIGIALVPLAYARLEESHGPADQLDIARSALAGVGLLGLVYGIVRGAEHGWTCAQRARLARSSASCSSSPSSPGSCALRRRCSRCASSARAPSRAANGVSLAMYFGVFGAIFLLAQYFQVAQGYSPLEAGLRTLPWTGDADDRRPDRGPALATASARGR